MRQPIRYPGGLSKGNQGMQWRGFSVASAFSVLARPASSQDARALIFVPQANLQQEVLTNNPRVLLVQHFPPLALRKTATEQLKASAPVFRNLVTA